MSSLMDSYEAEELDLVGDDFPWRQKADHPNDYIVASEPIEPEYIFHHVRGSHSCLWLRVSWKLAEGKFIPMSFLLDTGAPNHFYLCDRAMSALEDGRLVNEEEDMGVECTKVFGRKCLIEPTPVSQQPANVIGLKMLKRLGLQLYEDVPHFSFSKVFRFLCSTEVE